MNKNLTPDAYSAKMRAACPVPGDDWFKYMLVVLEPGANIKQHKHRQHLVMYYDKPADPIIIHPQAGTMLYLPIGTLHEVPPVTSQRFSRAMLIEEPKCK